MRRFTIKWLVMSFLVVCGVFYGVEMATQGIINIHGPLTVNTVVPQLESPEDMAKPQPETPTQPPVLVSTVASDRSNPLGQPKPMLLDKGVSLLANKTGGLLQIMAHHGIESIVSLFEKVLQ